jgi:hypothetical protein
VRRPLLVARGLGAGGPWAAAFVVAVFWRFLTPEPLAVFGQGDVRAVVWPLLPVVLAAMVPASTAFCERALEQVCPRPWRELRLRSLAMVMGAAALVVVTSGHDLVVVTRNTALLVGLAYLGASLIPAGLGWVPVVVYPSSCWLLGTRSSGIHASWAVLLRPPDDPAATAAAVVVALAGVVAFVGWAGAPRR